MELRYNARLRASTMTMLQQLFCLDVALLLAFHLCVEMVFCYVKKLKSSEKGKSVERSFVAIISMVGRVL